MCIHVNIYIYMLEYYKGYKEVMLVSGWAAAVTVEFRFRLLGLWGVVTSGSGFPKPLNPINPYTLNPRLCDRASVLSVRSGA